MSNLPERAETTLPRHLGMEIVESTKDRVVLTMPVRPEVLQPWGLLHGGASVALAETAASMAAWNNCDQSKEMAVGIEINANHLRAKRDGRVTATATPEHIGRSTQVWSVKVVDEEGRAICVSRCTVAVVPNR